MGVRVTNAPLPTGPSDRVGEGDNTAIPYSIARVVCSVHDNFQLDLFPDIIHQRIFQKS